jgi:hypothetical protein
MTRLTYHATIFELTSETAADLPDRGVIVPD